MSVEPVRINVVDKHRNAEEDLNGEISKELKNMSYNRYLKGKDTLDIATVKNHNSNRLQWNWLIKVKFIRAVIAFLKRGPRLETQLEVFQSTMKYCLISGQWLGLFPFANITKMNIKDNGYIFFSWRYLLCVISCSGQIMTLVLSFYGLVSATVTMTRLSFFLFYMSNCFTSVLFMRLGTKWHYLMKQIVVSELNEYLDSSVRFKGNFATTLILSFAIVEYIFSRIAKLAEVQGCGTADYVTYEQFIIASYTWLFELGVPYSLPLGIYLMILNTTATIIWSYSHTFIICVSLYLTSVLDQLNKKIISREGQHLPVSNWRKLREDYNKATRLVRYFDEAINSIVFITFASNLFFVCLQLYYLIAKYFKIDHTPEVECPIYHNGLFNGYEHIIYFAFSLMFVLSRFLAVMLIAARVHSASLVVAPSLYNVPSSSYGPEVHRFLEQIHGDTVALTGLNFFYVTKELVLSVVGTIVTYELVLLQFN